MRGGQLVVVVVVVVVGSSSSSSSRGGGGGGDSGRGSDNNSRECLGILAQVFQSTHTFSRFLKGYSHKAVGSRIEKSYMSLDHIFNIMILASTSHQCRRQALRISWISSRKPFTLPDRFI